MFHSNKTQSFREINIRDFPKLSKINKSFINSAADSCQRTEHFSGVVGFIYLLGNEQIMITTLN